MIRGRLPYEGESHVEYCKSIVLLGCTHEILFLCFLETVKQTIHEYLFLVNLNISCPSGFVRWEYLVCDINQVEHEFMQGLSFCK